jgi:hypothetical protein
MLPPTTILEGEDNLVGEGTSHRYVATMVDDETGLPIQLAALTSVQGWLWDDTTGVIVNARTAVNLLPSVVDIGGGVAQVVWALAPADAVVLDATAKPGDRERHAIELRVAYTKVGGGAGGLRRRTLYDVQKISLT